MSLSSFVKTGIVLSVLAFLTSLLDSLFLSIFFASSGKVYGIIVLIAFLIIAGLLLFFAFYHNEDSKKKWEFIFTAVFAIVGGIIVISIPTRFHNTASILDRTVVYTIPSIALSSVLSIAWVFLTGFIIRDVLDSAKIDVSQERLLYISVNLIQALLVSMMIAFSSRSPYPDISTLDVYSEGFVYSIAVWILNAIIFFVIAYFITKNDRVDIAADYNSVPEPIPQTNYDNIA